MPETDIDALKMLCRFGIGPSQTKSCGRDQSASLLEQFLELSDPTKEQVQAVQEEFTRFFPRVTSHVTAWNKIFGVEPFSSEAIWGYIAGSSRLEEVSPEDLVELRQIHDSKGISTKCWEYLEKNPFLLTHNGFVYWVANQPLIQARECMVSSAVVKERNGCHIVVLQNVMDRRHGGYKLVQQQKEIDLNTQEFSKLDVGQTVLLHRGIVLAVISQERLQIYNRWSLNPLGVSIYVP